MWETSLCPEELQPLFVDVCSFPFRVSAGFWPLLVSPPHPHLPSHMPVGRSHKVFFLLFECFPLTLPQGLCTCSSVPQITAFWLPHAIRAWSNDDHLEHPPLMLKSILSLQSFSVTWPFLVFCLTFIIGTCHVYSFSYLFSLSLPVKVKLYEGRNFICLFITLSWCLEHTRLLQTWVLNKLSWVVEFP